MNRQEPVVRYILVLVVCRVKIGLVLRWHLFLRYIIILSRGSRKIIVQQSQRIVHTFFFDGAFHFIHHISRNFSSIIVAAWQQEDKPKRKQKKNRVAMCISTSDHYNQEQATPPLLGLGQPIPFIRSTPTLKNPIGYKHLEILKHQFIVRSSSIIHVQTHTHANYESSPSLNSKHTLHHIL